MGARRNAQALLWVFAAGSCGGAGATNGDQMLGVTATQWGMAGAVTAAPQDAGTVLTNPAGLGVVAFDEFRADMGFGFLNPPRKANGAHSDSDLYMIPSGALAFRINERLSVGLGMAGLSGMGVDFDDISAVGPGNQNVVTTKQFFKVAPGFSYRVGERLYLGAAFNLDYQSLAMDLNGQMPLHLPQNQVYGFGASVGAIWRPRDHLSVGLSYVTEQAMEPFEWNASDGHYSLDMDAPAQLALGLAYQPGPDLLIEFDVKHIAFSDVLDTIDLERDGAPAIPLRFGWDDQTVYAVALQRRIGAKTTVRLGYNHGDSPIDPEDVKSNIGSLAVTEDHFTLGLTRQLGEKVFGSLSYARAFNNEITSSDGSTTIELEQNVVNLQITYRN